MQSKVVGVVYAGLPQRYPSSWYITLFGLAKSQKRVINAILTYAAFFFASGWCQDEEKKRSEEKPGLLVVVDLIDDHVSFVQTANAK